MMMETNTPGLHDAILLCAGVAAVYLVVALLQLMQLKHPRALSLPAREPSVGLALPTNQDSAKASDDSFASQLRQRGIEADLKRLSHEVDALRSELRATQDDLKLLRNERSLPSATPLYNEAMSFAKRGINADGIAARCGISRGEAELLAALVRNPKELGLASDAPAPSPTANNQRDEQQHDRYRAAA